jgi:hypothetical protein
MMNIVQYRLEDVTFVLIFLHIVYLVIMMATIYATVNVKQPHVKIVVYHVACAMKVIVLIVPLLFVMDVKIFFVKHASLLSKMIPFYTAL